MAVAAAAAAVWLSSRRPRPRPAVTVGSFSAAGLVSDVALSAYSTTNRDTHLVNSWGIAFNPKGFVWVADNGTDSSTLYDGNGVPQSLIVSTPPSPTGIVFNGSTTDFMLTSGGKSGASPFVFATESGMLAAWSPAVESAAALSVYDGSAAGKVYKGLAIGSSGGANFLYATDFHDGAVDMFNGSFQLSPASGAFHDPALPAGFAPFGIQAVGNLIYVSYAMQDAAAHDEMDGAGLGLIDRLRHCRHLHQGASGGRRAQRALGHGDGAKQRLRRLQRRAAGGQFW